MREENRKKKREVGEEAEDSISYGLNGQEERRKYRRKKKIYSGWIPQHGGR
jgi:hypothetical protein